MNLFRNTIVLLIAITFFFACEKDKNPVSNNDSEYPTVQTSNIKDGAVYYNFSQDDIVPVYDLKFGTYNRSPEFYTNPEMLGTDKVKIYNVENAALADVDSVDEAAFAVDVDSSIAGDSWYNYDFQTHTLSAKSNVYVVKSATGSIVKFQVANYNSTEAKYTVAYATWDAASKSFSGELTVDVPAGSDTEETFFSFADGVVAPAKWDIKLCIIETFVPEAGFSMSFPAILLNSEEGVLGAVVTDQEFAAVDKEAITGLQADTPEAMTIGADWFDYDSNTHRVISKELTYVIQTTSEERVKFHITNYYNEDGVSGFFSFEYEK